MSYESPIKLTNTMDSIVKRVREEGDKKIYECIANYGIDVNKEELEKALRYDRDQYAKGYEDGKAEAMQWIPVSEREPEEPEDGFKRYIVQRASKAEPRSLYWDQYGTWLDEEGTPYTDIIAWMELPEPYKEGE